MVRCRFAMNATFSLVPTPSALETSTGSRHCGGIELEEAAERSDVGQHAGREGGFRQLLDAADRFVARVDVDTGRLVVHGQGLRSLTS